MTLQEYQQIENYSYEEYCDYLINKYGAATEPYFTDTYWTKTTNKPKQPVPTKARRTKEGLFLHHKQENHVASLSTPEVAAKHPYEMQSAENLVPCDYLEHLLLHIMICEDPQPFEGEYVGANGTLTWILPALVSYFEKRHIPLEWQLPCFERIENDKETYEALIDRFIHSELIQENCNVTEEELQNLVSDRLVFNHNEIVMEQLEDFLSRDTKALVDLGTGLGKTTTALQYAIDHSCNCLALCPQNIIKDGWKKAAMTLSQRVGKKLDVMSYVAFADKCQTIDWSQYDLVICDEAHHCRGAVWGKGVRYVIENKLVKVIGLTATPADVADTIFGGNLCKGLSVVEGVEQGIIHPISYVGAYYDTTDVLKEVEEFGDQELLGQLNLVLNNTPTLKHIIQSNMPAGPRKSIIFTQSIEAMDQAIEILKDIYPDGEYRKLHSKMSEQEIAENKKWFEETREGFLCAVNMISEGAHYRGVNTIFMFRRTKSELLFQQQIGRIITLSKFDNPNAILFDLVNNANSVEVSKPLKVSIGKRKQFLEQEKNFAESEQIIIKDYTAEIVEVLKNIPDKNWTADEDDILKIFYPNEGARGVLNRLNNKRTLIAINHRAYKLKIRNITHYHIGIGVKCIETGIVYESAMHAVRDNENTNNTGILNCCNGKQLSCGGKHWCFAQENLAVTEIEQSRCQTMKKAIICLETKEVYESAQEAYKQTGISYKNISSSCNHTKGRQTAGGYHWEFLCNCPIESCESVLKKRIEEHLNNIRKPKKSKK